MKSIEKYGGLHVAECVSCCDGCGQLLLDGLKHQKGDSSILLFIEMIVLPLAFFTMGLGYDTSV